jgi:hypothetical protein
MRPRSNPPGIDSHSGESATAPTTENASCMWSVSSARLVSSRRCSPRPDSSAEQAPNRPARLRGTVTDSASGRGIGGAQVTVTGTTRGGLTNDAGAYTIRDVPVGTATVRAQRIGFAPADRQVTVTPAGVTADFALVASARTLSEVVVVGYGTSSRQNVSSAIASVTAEEIANTPVAGVDAALQGKAAGVQVIQNAGNPGNGISVRVRGPASINAGNQPLYVVDGVPILQENYPVPSRELIVAPGLTQNPRY